MEARVKVDWIAGRRRGEARMQIRVEFIGSDDILTRATAQGLV